MSVVESELFEAETVEESEDKALKFEENLARFEAKMAMVPQEYRKALGWLYANRQIQDQRKRLQNRKNQLKPGKKTFWGRVLSDEIATPIEAAMDDAEEALGNQEARTAKNVKDSLRHTTWYQEVCIPSSRGFGMSATGGHVSAAKILDAFVSPSRFQTFGQFIRYARLAPENGKAPKREKGRRIHYNPKAFQALFDLSEVWLKTKPENCIWRAMWDEWKVYYLDRFPDKKTHPPIRILNMARRKVMREFLRGLWELWTAWEEKYNVNRPQ